MSEFTWLPSIGTEKSVDPKVDSAKFGDGYEQRAAHGINNMQEIWPAYFKARPAAEATAIENFFKQRKGEVSFTWTPPDEEEIRVVARSWKKKPIGGGLYDVTAQFEQVFETI